MRQQSAAGYEGSRTIHRDLRLPAATRFERRPGRRKFAPARIVTGDAGPQVEILGRGGSARLKPLVDADGLVEIEPLQAPVEIGSTVAFHSFFGGFTV
jgi:molybdopterin molybdotransferase